jgi:hypothetical protein
VEVASHVIEVELHVYIYHLIEKAGYNLHKVRNPILDDYTKEPIESLEIVLTKQNGEVVHKPNQQIPQSYTNCVDFYILDLPQPVFFPSYLCHTLSPNGVILKHIVWQTMDYRTQLPFTMLMPEMMLSIELDEIRTIEWKTGRGRQFRMDFVTIPDWIQKNRIYSPPKKSEEEFKKMRELAASKVIITEKKVDLRPLCPRVFNQGDLGTCGVTNFTSLLEWISGKKFSVLFLYWNVRVKIDGELPWDDHGTELASTIRAACTYGMCSDEKWPYNPAKFLEEPPPECYEEAKTLLKIHESQFRRLHSLDELKECLRRGRPVLADLMFGGEAYSKTPTRTGKIPKMPPDSVIVDNNEHSCVIVGYDNDLEVLIIQNSWGTGWGVGGFGFVPYQYILTNHYTHLTTWCPEDAFSDNRENERVTL